MARIPSAPGRRDKSRVEVRSRRVHVVEWLPRRPDANQCRFHDLVYLWRHLDDLVESVAILINCTLRRRVASKNARLQTASDPRLSLFTI